MVDANVLSDPTKADSHPKVVEWLRRNEREIAVDPIVLGELRFGIRLLSEGKRRARPERWFDAGVRIVDASIGRQPIRPASASESAVTR